MVEQHRSQMFQLLCPKIVWLSSRCKNLNSYPKYIPGALDKNIDHSKEEDEIDAKKNRGDQVKVEEEGLICSKIAPGIANAFSL